MSGGGATRFFFSAQGVGIDLWHHVADRLRLRIPGFQAGYWVAHHQQFDRYLASSVARPPGDALLLKEWEILDEARHTLADHQIIAQYEQRLGNPNLWGPLVGDRRIYQGRRVTFRQDYRPRFTHAEMLAILQVALVRMDAAFQAFAPDVVITNYPATFGDYLAFLFGRERGALTLDLRLTGIRNHVVGAETIFEPSDHVRSAYLEMVRNGVARTAAEEAEETIDALRRGTPVYDGVVLAGSAPTSRALTPTRKRSAVDRAVSLASHWLGGYHRDNHIPNPLLAFLYRSVLNPIRRRWIEWRLRKHYVDPGELAGMTYAFYPLHTEPELTMSVYARPFLNQIEVVRLLSHSLPVTWSLLVKEHPATHGRRPYAYYRKLLDIPNVRLVRPSVPARNVIQHARLVSVITGTVAFEALVERKPVVVLGRSRFDYLPSSMVRVVRDLYRLPEETSDLLASHEHDEDALVSYVAATLASSRPINLVTDLLAKPGRYRGVGADSAPELDRHPHLDVLADYIVARTRESRPATAVV